MPDTEGDGEREKKSHVNSKNADFSWELTEVTQISHLRGLSHTVNQAIPGTPVTKRNLI